MFLVAILYYDHATTFDEECRRIWDTHSLRSGASTFFIVNRYFAFFTVCARTSRRLLYACTDAPYAQNVAIGIGNFMEFESTEVRGLLLIANVMLKSPRCARGSQRFIHVSPRLVLNIGDAYSCGAYSLFRQLCLLATGYIIGGAALLCLAHSLPCHSHTAQSANFSAHMPCTGEISAWQYSPVASQWLLPQFPLSVALFILPISCY